jgi:hypothetical protein
LHRSGGLGVASRGTEGAPVVLYTRATGGAAISRRGA